MESGKGSGNYWPGFVDALTNVVIAMVFVIVVLAIALAFAAQLMGKRVAEEMIKKHMEAAVLVQAKSESSASTEKPGPDAALKTEVQQVKRIAVTGNEKKTTSNSGKIKGSNNYLELEFIETALTLDEKASEQFKQSLKSILARSPKASVQLVATSPSMQLTENQRVAYIRIMSVRNFLIEQGFSPDRIKVRIDLEKPTPSPLVSVVISTAP